MLFIKSKQGYYCAKCLGWLNRNFRNQLKHLNIHMNLPNPILRTKTTEIFVGILTDENVRFQYETGTSLNLNRLKNNHDIWQDVQCKNKRVQVSFNLKFWLSIFSFVSHFIVLPHGCCVLKYFKFPYRMSKAFQKLIKIKPFYLRKVTHRLRIVKRLNDALTDSGETCAILCICLYK